MFIPTVSTPTISHSVGQNLNLRDAMLNILIDNPSIEHFVLTDENSWSIQILAPVPEKEEPVSSNEGMEQESNFSQDEISSIPNHEEQEADFPESARQYRTRNQAGQVAKMPKALAIITQKDYQYALSFKQGEQAYLQLAKEQDKMQFLDGQLVKFGNIPLDRIDMKLYCTDNGISDVDIPQLLALYSVIWNDLQKDLPQLLEEKNEAKYIGHSIKMYLPDFFRLMGKTTKQNKEDIGLAVAKIRSYSSIVGIIEEPAHGRVYRSIYAAMVFHGYNEAENTIYFSSPYCNMVIMKVLKASIRRDKKGNRMINKNQQPILLPHHSYLVKPELAKIRNKRAAEIICAIVALVERAGSHEPHISARNLVNRCPALKQTIEGAATTSDKNKALRRSFAGAWKHISEYTELSKRYQGIKFPSAIPTMATLDDLVFTFPHNGKRKEQNADQN